MVAKSLIRHQGWFAVDSVAKFTRTVSLLVIGWVVKDVVILIGQLLSRLLMLRSHRFDTV